MKKIKIISGISLFLITLLMYSCQTAGEINLMQDKGPYYSKTPYKDYRLQVNDEIACSILTGNEDLATLFNSDRAIYTIYDNGEISIPFFGDIKIVGLTIPEAESVIQQKMKNSIADAQVIVRLHNNLFYIVSNKSQNGAHILYKDNMTIFQALAISGQADELIDYSKVKIIRMGPDGRSSEKTFDLRTTSIIESEFYYIKPNDIIYYSTSGKRSFFNVPSVSGLINTIVTPIFFIATALSL